MGISCIGLNGGDMFKHNEAFSFQVATEDQAETTAIGTPSSAMAGRRVPVAGARTNVGISWQITPRILTRPIPVRTGPPPKRAFAAMMEMAKIDVAKIEAALKG